MKETVQNQNKAQAVPASQVLHTPDGEMPDTEFKLKGQSEADVQAAFSSDKKSAGKSPAAKDLYPEKIRESSGDLADQAEEQIEVELRDKINSIRSQNRI